MIILSNIAMRITCSYLKPLFRFGLAFFFRAPNVPETGWLMVRGGIDGACDWDELGSAWLDMTCTRAGPGDEPITSSSRSRAMPGRIIDCRLNLSTWNLRRASFLCSLSRASLNLSSEATATVDT